LSIDESAGNTFNNTRVLMEALVILHNTLEEHWSIAESIDNTRVLIWNTRVSCLKIK